MSKKHLNWYLLKNILESEFDVVVRWIAHEHMEFSSPNGRIMVSKSNNMHNELVEGVLEELGIDKREFERKRMSYQN